MAELRPSPNHKRAIAALVFSLLACLPYVSRADYKNAAADGFVPGFGDAVTTIAVQTDGKILIAGPFTGGFDNFGGSVPGRLARLNADGRVDTAFNPVPNDSVQAIEVQADGKIVVGGSFTSLQPKGTFPEVRNKIARLNAGGTLDPGFDPNLNGDVKSIAVQADGKILVGGAFTAVAPNGGAEVTRNYLARLNPDGTLDTAFAPILNSGVQSIALQTDGKILVAGSFGVARLNVDGTIDPGFHPAPVGGVSKVAVQANGKVLVAGSFTSVSNRGTTVARNGIARLDADGEADLAFDPSPDNVLPVTALAVQPDGKILLGGRFTVLAPNGGASVTRNRIARLTVDGTVDLAWNPGANGEVDAIAVQNDGKVVLGGAFTALTSNGGA